MKLISGTHPYTHPHPGVNTHKHTHTLQKKNVDVARLCGPQLSDSVVSFPKIIPTTLRGIPGLQPPAGAGLKLTELALPLCLSVLGSQMSTTMLSWALFLVSLVQWLLQLLGVSSC